MKISIDGFDLISLTETQKKVIQNDLNEDVFEADIKRRLRYILEQKYQQSFKRLKQEWEPKLKADGIEFIPTNEEAFAKLVITRPDYKSRKQRELSNLCCHMKESP